MKIEHLERSDCEKISDARLEYSRKKRWIFVSGFFACICITAALYFHNFHEPKGTYIQELGSLFFGLVALLTFFHLRFKSLADELRSEIRREIEEDFKREHGEI